MLMKVCAKKMQIVFFLLNGVGTANFGLQNMTLPRAGTGQNVMVFSSLNMRKRYEIDVFGILGAKNVNFVPFSHIQA